MTDDEKAPACRIEEHGECAGPAVVRRAGAPAWEEPIEVLRCGCSCHASRRLRRDVSRAA